MKRVFGLLAFTLLLACHDESPGKGTLELTLETTSTSDGAMVLTIYGGKVSAVHPAPGYQVATTVDSIGTHLIFVGDLKAGSLGTIEIPDSRSVSQYLADVEQVADRASFAVLDPLRYHISLTAVLGE